MQRSRKGVFMDWIKKAVAVFLLVGLAFCMEQGKEQIQERDMQQEIADKVLRFHVRANSDSKEDQALKLRVRDAVGVLMKEKLKDAASLEDCKRITGQELGEIVDKAEDVIRESGYTYAVEASVSAVDFPDKTYGAYTFPAGRYDALEVVIGNGAGHNWWCVLYPNMCFAGSTYEVVEEQAKEKLQRTLTNEEYQSLMEKKNYTIKCKYLTFLNKYMEKM